MPARDYFALVESFEAFTADLRDLPAAGHTAHAAALQLEATRLLRAFRPGDFENLMVWHTDRHYRLVHEVSMLDGASFVFLRAVGAAFDTVTRERGRAMAYVADNQVPPDRLAGLRAFFAAMGFMVASPELLAVQLGEHDGVSEEDALGPRFAYYRTEAVVVAKRVFEAGLDAGRHVLWVSGAAEVDELRHIVRAVEGRPYVGVFRNDVPVEGSEVNVFQSDGVHRPLTF